MTSHRDSLTVATRQWVISLLLAAALCMLAACSGGSTLDVKNQPPPPNTSVSIQVQTVPSTGTILINGTATLSATVTGDSSNSGVDWIVTCSVAGNCGTLSSSHTASSDGSVTYTPPATLLGNNQTIDVVAFSAADHNSNVATPITITAFGGALEGTYVFQAKGSDVSSFPYQIAGILTLDGSGNITSGTQTLNTISGSLTTSTLPGSSYFVGSDGRGSITLNTTDIGGDPLTEHFTIMVLSASQAFIAESDSPQTSSGTMDLQTSTATPTGGYAFAMSGIDGGGLPAAFGGIVNIDNNPSPGDISGTGSVADQDYSGFLASCATPAAFSGSTIAPDPNTPGLYIFNLAATNPTTGLACLGFGSITANGYVIDSTHIALIETDGGFLTGGVAISQGASTGTFSLASLSGNYVFGLLGIDMSISSPSSFTSVGMISPDGSGALSNGFMDTFLQASCVQSSCLNDGISGSQISSQFSGTYTIDTKGIGRVHLALANYSPQPRPGYRPNFILYLTGSGTSPLMLDAGGEDVNYPSMAAGTAYPRAATNLTLNGNYGVTFTQQNGGENDGTGRFAADAAANPQISGTVNDLANGNIPVALSDAFGATDSDGRIAGTFLGNQVEYYPIDSGHGFFVETDLTNPAAPSGQVSFGYYAPLTLPAGTDQKPVGKSAAPVKAKKR